MDASKKIEKIKSALSEFSSSMEECDLCLRKCGVNRLKGEKGYCKAGRAARVYAFSPHFGEEPVISGSSGSGTIFFSGCSMGCVYCQNHQFSHSQEGRDVTVSELSRFMISLQDKDCHNINLVTPTHYIPQILEALLLAYENGLKVPVVYNTGGYDSPHVISALRGIVDIYLADMRYSDESMAIKYSDALGYVENNLKLIPIMKQQVGELDVAGGVACKGLIIRLLVLPGGISGTEKTLANIRSRIGAGVHISLMSQYCPLFRAGEYPEIDRPITEEEYSRATHKMEELGLDLGWIQPHAGGSDDEFIGENFSQNV